MFFWTINQFDSKSLKKLKTEIFKRLYNCVAELKTGYLK